MVNTSNHLWFADDIILIANNPDELQQSISVMNAASNEIELKMDQENTKILFNELVQEWDIIINDTKLEIVYLGHLNQKSDSLLPEIRKTIHLKKRTFDQCILPVLAYGCETWLIKTPSCTRSDGTIHARNNANGWYKNRMD